MILSAKPGVPPIDAEWIIHTDGATLGKSPSAVGSAALTVWVNGMVYHAETHQKIRTSNNEIEFFALLRALMWCDKHYIDNIDIYTDSMLLQQWSEGIAKLKNKDIRRLGDDCYAFRNRIDFRVHWVPREEEKQQFTDYISKLGLLSDVRMATLQQHKLLIGAYYENPN